MKLIIFFLILLTNLFDTGREFYIKSAVNKLNTSPRTIKEIIAFIFRLVKIPRLWLGFIFSVLALVTWLLVLSKAELNYAFSLDSMHYIFIAFVSQKILKEKIGFKRWVGIIFIVVGIALVSVS